MTDPNGFENAAATAATNEMNHPAEDLTVLRTEITEIDDEMAALFARRMAVSASIADYKKAHGLPTFDPKRERENLEKAKTRVAPELQELYREFLQKNMDLSKAYQEIRRKGEDVS